MDWRDKFIAITGWALIIGLATMQLWIPFFSGTSDSSAESTTPSSIVEKSSIPHDVDPPDPYEEYDNVPPDYGYDDADFSNYDYNEDYNSYTDLDCADIGYEHYVGYDDPNGLDGDGDGWACEGW